MSVEHEKYLLAQKVDRLTAKLYALTGRNRHTPVSPESYASSAVLDGDRLDQEAIKQEREDGAAFLPTPQKSVDHDSPHSRPSSSCSFSPSPSEIGLGRSAFEPPSDLTQHPAAMLCGLQCQSGAGTQALLPSVVWQHPSRMVFIQLLNRTLVSLIYSPLRPALRSIFHSTWTASPRRSKTSPRVTSMILLLLNNWLISTPSHLPRPAKTSSATTTTQPTVPTGSAPPSVPLLTARRATSRLRHLRRLLFCSPALARPLKDATSKAMRTKTRRALTGTSTDSLRGGNRQVDVHAGNGRGPSKVEDGEEFYQRRRVRDEQEAAMIQAMMTTIKKVSKGRGSASREKRIKTRRKKS